MTDKQTICPNCKTTYRVSLPQLTVAQGMVCCPKCNTNFNALVHLIQHESTPSLRHSTENTSIQNTELATQQNHHSNQEISESRSPLNDHPKSISANMTTYEEITSSAAHNKEHGSTIHEMFDRKIENSNIDLRTYLNNLNQFNQDPLTSIPSLNLSSGQAHQHSYSSKSHTNTRKPLYYFCWSMVNIVLILILVFQILWFNPALLDKYPALNTVFHTTCQIFKCNTIEERYNHIKFEQFKVQKIQQSKTKFSGSMINTYKKSLKVPTIKLTLKAQGETVYTQTISSKEYLNESLKGISRIPSNAPYKFEFTIDKARNSFDDYNLEIIPP